MTRTTTAVSTFLGLLLINQLGFAQVNVTTKVPASVTPGGEFTVEMTIDKGSIAGFAKLQHDLPSGFEASPLESNNATFSFKDRKVKYLWMALPAEGKFNVSYKIKVDATVEGNQILEGNFSYIKDNNTEKFIIPKDIIAVQPDASASNQKAQADRAAQDSKRKEEEANAARQQAKEEPKQAEPVKQAEPSNESTQSSSNTSNDEAQRAEADRKAAEKKANDEAAAARKAEEKLKSDEAAAAKRAEKEAAAATAKSNFNDSMLKTKEGLVFRVQIAAGPKDVDPAYFMQKHNITDQVSIEKHDGLNKYVVGEFGSYRPAKTFCNTLRDSNSVEGPFVTAYHNGERIDVRRALEIAGQ